MTDDQAAIRTAILRSLDTAAAADRTRAARTEQLAATAGRGPDDPPPPRRRTGRGRHLAHAELVRARARAELNHPAADTENEDHRP